MPPFDLKEKKEDPPPPLDSCATLPSIPKGSVDQKPTWLSCSGPGVAPSYPLWDFLTEEEQTLSSVDLLLGVMGQGRAQFYQSHVMWTPSVGILEESVWSGSKFPKSEILFGSSLVGFAR